MEFNFILYCRDIEEYCAKFINPLGVDAEGPVVELGILPLCLGCKCEIVYLDKESKNSLMHFRTCLKEYAPSAMIFGSLTVHLLLRPGHYDLMVIIFFNERLIRIIF